ncbi:MAG: efflux RND transporter periplasmic adaptor subunit [Nitrospirae bacterium]|nr:efflux RND transporter periplasmic adaptor subunit [Nitrospirota bacterium]
MKKILIVLFVLVLIGGSIFIFTRKTDNKVKYKTEKVVIGEIRSTVTATGTINPIILVNVGAQVSGLIKELFVDFNSQVKKGKVIALIDPRTFTEQVTQAKANLDVALTNLDKANATLFDAKRTFEREQELVKKDFEAASVRDTAETNYQIAKSGVGAAKAQIQQAKAALKQAQTNLEYTSIVSPVDGIVISRNVDIGQTVVSSMSAPTLFTIAKDLSKMQIDTNIVEADIGRIKVGQDVDFTVDAYPDITFKGVVQQVRNAPIIVQNVVTYDVVVRVENDKLLLKPGMTANIAILTSKVENILKIPNAALRFSPAREKDKSSPSVARFKGKGVWIIDNNKPKRISVKTGINDNSFTEILSGELKEGQDLIVESLIEQKSSQGMQGPRMF